MQEQMGQFDDNRTNTAPTESFTKQKTSSASKGDYIDFEEVK